MATSRSSAPGDDWSATLPDRLHPGNDLEKWQDGIEVAWEVVEKELGLTHDDVHRRIAAEQKADWETFVKSAEERRKNRKP